MTKGIKRLRTLYSVLAGIPNRRIYLGNFYGGTQQVGEQFVHNCGTTACAGGWAAVYPEFVAAGLYADEGGTIRFGDATDFSALAKFFDIDYSDVCEVFDTAAASDFTKGLDEDSIYYGEISDKRVALHRIRLYLRKQRAISKKRSKELAAFEKQF
jgi:hypothetical protein